MVAVAAPNAEDGDALTAVGDGEGQMIGGYGGER
jgi:hypothetical protein